LSKDWPGANQTPRWDEYIPQCYRFSYDAYEKTWLDQVKYMNELGAGRVKDLIAGIRLVGEGKDSTWDDLRKSVELVRKTGGGGHVHWFSRGVLDVFPNELTTFYDVVGKGRSPHPVFGADWRPAPIRMIKKDGVWNAEVPTGAYRVIAKKNGVWRTIGAHTATKSDGPGLLPVPAVRDDGYEAVELLVDRREALGKPRRP
jgi:hypothetical protein